MYGNLNNFLDVNELDSLVNYDLKNESPWEDVKTETNPIKKFQKYKINNRNAYSAGEEAFDCDVSNFTHTIFQRLWLENWSDILENCKGNFGEYWEEFSEDTMNSFSTTYLVARKIYKNNLKKIMANQLLTKFASNTHCIGNFTYVPYKLYKSDNHSFNQYRGFRREDDDRYFVYDYFDLSLKLIKESTDEITFRDYIDVFYLNDYVDENYNIIPLFERHRQFLNNEKLPLEHPEQFLPQNEKELNEYVANVLELIELRGKRIVEELQAKMTDNDDVVECLDDKNDAVKEEETESNKESVCTPKTKHKKNILKKIISSLWGKIAIAILFITVVCVIWQLHVMLQNVGGFLNLCGQYGTIPVLVDIMKTIPPMIIDILSILVFIAALCVALLFILRKFAYRRMWLCEECNHLFSYRKEKTVLDRSEDISIKVELETKNRDREVIGTSEQYIPGVREHYIVYYVCKHCGRRMAREKTRDVKKI